jgi:hypothetical protein
MKIKAIKPTYDRGGDKGALIYDGIKGKVARHVRIYLTDRGTTMLVIQFADNTEFQVAMDSPSVVHLSLLTNDGERDQRLMATSKIIPVPRT